MRKCSAFTHGNRNVRADTVTAQTHNSVSLESAFPPGGTQDSEPQGRAGQNRDNLSPLGARVLETKQGMKIITFGPESTVN